MKTTIDTNLAIFGLEENNLQLNMNRIWMFLTWFLYKSKRACCLVGLVVCIIAAALKASLNGIVFLFLLVFYL